MKTVKIFILIFLCGYLFSCKHDDSSSPSGASMSASVSGVGTINLSASFTNSNGVTVLEGSSNTCTIMIYLQLNGPASYLEFQSPGTYPYATISTSSISGTCTTYANDGQLNITTSSSSGLYDGTFSFTATGNSGSVSVTSGQFTNL